MAWHGPEGILVLSQGPFVQLEGLVGAAQSHPGGSGQVAAGGTVHDLLEGLAGVLRIVRQDDLPAQQVGLDGQFVAGFHPADQVDEDVVGLLDDLEGLAAPPVGRQTLGLIVEHAGLVVRQHLAEVLVAGAGEFLLDRGGSLVQTAGGNQQIEFPLDAPGMVGRAQVGR